jgi:hypothetical protein
MKYAFNAEPRFISGRTRRRNGFARTGAGLTGGRSTRKRVSREPCTHISAGIAGRRFKQTESKAHTVPCHVLPMREGGRSRMNDELRKAVVGYKTAMAIIKEMVKSGVITEADMAVAEAEIARKYGIKSISIFR